MKINYRNKENVEKFRTVSVDLRNNIEVTQRYPTLIGGQYVLHFPSQGGITSIKNFILERNGDIVFAFQKKYDEEHLLYLKYPFTLFQAFALALSMMI